MQLTIDYKPTAKGSARTRLVNGRVLTYYNHKTTEALEAIRTLIASKHLKPFPPHVPIRLEVTFWRTKSKWLARKETLPFRKPDNTNYIKLVEDCVSPILVPDDAQITTTLARKRWSPNNHGYIEIKLEGDKL